MQIKSLQTFEIIPDMYQPQFNGHTAIFIYETDGDGNPTLFDTKQYQSQEIPADT